MRSPNWLVPEWLAPPGVRTLITTRAGGVSEAPWKGLNLGLHVGDDPAAVVKNRRRLRDCLPTEPVWLEQVHGSTVVCAESGGGRADASVTRVLDTVCTIMSADCLPVLFCDQGGTVVAAAHAGWRGLAGGVLENTVQAMGVEASRILVWLGPAIGPEAFEVGEEVREAFVAVDPAAAVAFRPAETAGKWMGNLFALARRRLERAGVTMIYGGGHCTVSDPKRFYSYRRDGVTGRFASLIWLERVSG